MSRPTAYVNWIVLIHLAINIAHGFAHRELQVGLSQFQTIFVFAVILLSPLIAMALVWTRWKRPGFVLLSLSMGGSLVFGLYHHFLAMSADHVSAQPANTLGLLFRLTAYGLLITEALGTCAGIHFLRVAKMIGNNRTV
jgi:hypothetical protein